MPNGAKDGMSVFCREFGQGDQHALLLHCALAHSKAWAGVAEELQDRLRMIAPDMPGHGRSDWVRADHTLNDRNYVALFECLPEKAHLIGHSYGATLALRMALSVPERVQSLTLIEPVLFAAARESHPDVLGHYLHTAAPLGETMASGDWAEAARIFTLTWGDGRHWARLTDAERERLASQMPFIKATQVDLLEDTAGLLKPRRLESLSCPTLLVRGSETEPVIAAVHKTLSRRIPNAVDRVVEGAGHMVPITHPKPVAGHIGALLENH